MFVCNPNNPTGTILSKKQLTKIISAAKKKSSLVFVDECFIELVPESNQAVINLIKKHDNLFVLRSLTKSFGLSKIIRVIDTIIEIINKIIKEKSQDLLKI